MMQNKNGNKIINLLPLKIQEERQFEKMLKIAFGICLLPVIYYGFTYVAYLQKTNDLENMHLIQSEIDILQNEIKEVESNIFDNTRMISGLNNEHVPLNSFLLELGVIIPNDMILYSVVTENVEQEKVEKETSDSVGEEAEKNQNEEINNSDDIGGSEATDETEGQTDEGVIKTEEEIKKEEEKIKNQKTMFIRGAIENVDSLGIFIKELEENSYIEKVNMNTIENYYNGQDSFKIFELTVDIK